MEKGPLVTLKFCIYERESRDVFKLFFFFFLPNIMHTSLFLCCLIFFKLVEVQLCSSSFCALHDFRVVLH